MQQGQKPDQLHRNEKLPFMIAGKPYLWTRVNGVLQTESALRPDGSFTPAALDRIAGPEDGQ